MNAKMICWRWLGTEVLGLGTRDHSRLVSHRFKIPPQFRLPPSQGDVHALPPVSRSHLLTSPPAILAEDTSTEEKYHMEGIYAR